MSKKPRGNWSAVQLWFKGWLAPQHFVDRVRQVNTPLLIGGLAALLGSLAVGLLLAPPDIRQGESVRIIYLHVPAAIAVKSLYFGTALAAALFLLWRIRMAAIAMQACIPMGVIWTLVLIGTGMAWGLPTWGVAWLWGDPRMISTFIQMMIWLSLLVVQNAYLEPERSDRAVAIIAILGRETCLSLVFRLSGGPPFIKMPVSP